MYLIFSFIKAYRTKRFIHLKWDISVLKIEMLREMREMIQAKEGSGNCNNINS